MDEVPTPDPGPNEILVKVAACGVCHTDLHYIDHGTPTFKKPPVILGHEASGTVAAVGSEVSEWSEGDRVLLATIFACGHCAACREGRDNVCENQPMLGNSVDGAYAEYVLAPRHSAFSLPEEIPIEEGAIIADATTTPYHAVVNRGRVKPGNDVVVFGSGGIGAKVVQMAVILGARVVAVERQGFPVIGIYLGEGAKGVQRMRELFPRLVVCRAEDLPGRLGNLLRSLA